MKQVYTFLLLLFVTHNLNSQSIRDLKNYDTLTYTFELNELQLEYIYSKNAIQDTAWLFEHLYRTYSKENFHTDSLPYGNFITVEISENIMRFHYKPKYSFNYQLKSILNRNFIFINDIETASLIKDAKIYYKNELIKYDEGIGGYEIEDYSPSDTSKFLKIYFDKNVYLIRFQDKPIQQYNESVRLNRRTENWSPGYFITSKPKYKKGDTLQSKAFLTNYFNGKPIHKKVNIEIKDNQGKTYYSSELSSTTSGAYLFNWAIPDTLPLDRMYTISLFYDKFGYRFSKEAKFYLEDYNLESNNYSVIMYANHFINGEDIKLYANAKDANGFTLPEAKYNLKLFVDEIIDLYQDSLSIEDMKMKEWYSQDSAMDEMNTTEITIPKKALINGKVNYRIVTEITDQSLEKKSFTNQFSWDAKTDLFMAYQDNDSIKIHQYINMKDTSRKLQIQFKRDKVLIRKQNITTPFHCQIPYNASSIELYDGDKLVQKTPIEINYDKFLNLQGKRTHDSIWIKFDCRLESPICYTIYKDDKILSKGTSKVLNFKLEDKSSSTYYLLIHSNESGDIVNSTKYYSFSHNYKNLIVENNLPLEVMPGQILPLEFTVKNYDHSLARNINICSYAINSMFKNSIVNPDIYIPAKKHKEIQEEEIKSQQNFDSVYYELTERYPISKWALNKLQIYSNDFYKISYPKSSTYTHYFPLDSDKTEFCVVATIKGSLFKPTYFKIDGKFYYSYLTQLNQPYSVNVNQGEHTIECRILDKIYSFKNVLFKKGYKTIFSISIENILADKKSEFILKDSLPANYLTASEYQNLTNQCILIKDISADTLEYYSTQNMDYKQYFNPKRLNQIRTSNYDPYNIIGPFQDTNIILIFNNKAQTYFNLTRPFLYKLNNQYLVEHKIEYNNYIQYPIRSIEEFKFNKLIDSVYNPYTQKPSPDRIKAQIIKPKTETLSNKYKLATVDYAYENKLPNYVNFIFITNDSMAPYAIWLVDKKNSNLSNYSNIKSKNRQFIFNVSENPYDIIILFNDNTFFKIENFIFKSKNDLYFNTYYLRKNEILPNSLADYIQLNSQLTRTTQGLFSNTPTEYKASPNIISTTLRPQPFIRGLVLGVDGDRLNDVDVYLEKNGVFYAGAHSNSVGEFEFLNVEKGNYMVKVYNDEYSPMYLYELKCDKNAEYHITIQLEQKKSYNVTSYANNKELQLILKKSNSPKSNEQVIYDRESRVPLSGVDIVFYHGYEILHKTSSNNLGRFNSFYTNNPMYRYTIMLSKKGYKTLIIEDAGFNQFQKYENKYFLQKSSGENMSSERLSLANIQFVNDGAESTFSIEKSDCSSGSKVTGKISPNDILIDNNFKIHFYQNNTLVQAFDIKNDAIFNIKKLDAGRYDIVVFNHFMQSIFPNLEINNSECIHLDLDLFQNQEIIYEAEIDPSNSKQQENNFVKLNNSGDGEIRGKVTDDAGEAVPFSEIRIVLDKNGTKPTSKVTKTDLNGFYRLQGLASGYYFVMAKALGRGKSIQEATVVMGNPAILNFALSGVSKLNAVTVTAKIGGSRNPKMIDVYQPKENYISAAEVKSKSVRDINSLASSTGGVFQEDRGSALNVGGGRSDEVLYFVDGIKMTGSSSIPPAAISQVEILSINSNYYIPKNKSLAMFDKIERSSDVSTTREHFTDLGYWSPNLVTDKYGKAYATIKIPDNITTWQGYTLAMGRDFKHNVSSQTFRSYKPLILKSMIPKFIYNEDKLEGKFQLNNFDREERKINYSLILNGLEQFSKSSLIQRSLWDSFQIEKPAKSDTIEYLAKLKFNTNYSDGEKYKIPCLYSGLVFSENESHTLAKDSGFTLNVGENDKIKLIANNKIYDQILFEIDNLKNYPYGCTEQNTSKLKALLLQKIIYKKLNKPFLEEQLIKKMITKLEKSQENGYWGWWNGSQRYYRLTLYVLNVLHLAQIEGYSTYSSYKSLENLKKDISQLSLSDRLYLNYLFILYNHKLEINYWFNEIKANELSPTDLLYYLRIKLYMNSEVAMIDIYDYLGKLNTNKKANYTDDYMYDPTACNAVSLKVFENTKYEYLFAENIRPIISETVNWTNGNTFAKAQMIAAWLKIAEKDTLDFKQAQLQINDSIYNLPLQKNLITGNYKIKQIQSKSIVNVIKEARINQPKYKDTFFRITTNLDSISKWRVGEKLAYTIHIKAYESRKNIMIEIPIPASCRYESKPLAKGNQDYIEYKSEKATIFYSSLPSGEYHITIPLQAIFKGESTIPPVKASLMYYPFIFGNNQKTKINIY